MTSGYLMPGKLSAAPAGRSILKKGRVWVEVQFGKYTFRFCDRAPFPYFFNENSADVGIEIVPCHRLPPQRSTGVACGEQLIHDIERLKRHFPAVPVYILPVDV